MILGYRKTLLGRDGLTGGGRIFCPCRVIRLRALVAKREWGEIEDIAKAKKSPIGWAVSSFRVCHFLFHLVDRV